MREPILSRRETRWLILLACLLALAVAAFGWPGIYTYAVISGNTGQGLVRVNRLTGTPLVVVDTFPRKPQTAPAQTPPAVETKPK